MRHYFAKDGSFGEDPDILIVDTSDWTDDDWERIEDAADYDRVHVARAIAMGKAN